MPLPSAPIGQPDNDLALAAAAMACAPIGFATFDAELRCLTINPALAQLCRSSCSELRGLEMHSALPAGVSEKCGAAIEAAIQDGRATENLEFGHGGGTQSDSVWQCSIRPVTDPGSDAIVAGLWVLDVTERALQTEQLANMLRDREHKLTALTSQLTVAEEDVRRRVAQDLHEGMAQVLIGARYYLAKLETVTDEDHRLELVRVISEQVDAALADCRAVALDLSSPALHERGLGQAIELMASRFEDRTGIRCKVTGAEVDLGVSVGVRIALFQAVRELFTNVQKHALATKVVIDISRGPHTVTIRFYDNGVGCEGPHRAVPPPDGGGFGLFAIREHIGFLGGSVEIGCAPRQGCEVILTAPAPSPHIS